MTIKERFLARLDSITNSLSMLGTGNDKGRAGRPDTATTRLTDSELLTLWRHNGLSRRVVSLIPKDATKKGVRCEVDGVEGDPMREHLERLGALMAIRQAWTWGRLYGGALLLIVSDSDEDLSEPLEQANIINLVAFDRTEISAREWDWDVRSPVFSRPKRWFITPQGGLSMPDVHHSRVIYFGGDKLPPSRTLDRDGVDESILTSAWDQIRNKTSSEQGIASIVQESSVGVLKIEGLSELQASEGAQLFVARMKQIAIGKSLNNTVIMSEGEHYGRVATPLSGLAELDSRLAFALASVTGIPMTKLYGDAPGGLSTDGESGKQNWRDSVSAEQDEHLVPAIKKLAMVQLGIEIEVHPNPLDEPSEEQRSATMKTVAEADAIYLDRQVISEDEIRQARFVDGSLGAVSVEDADMGDPMREQAEAILNG